MPTLPKRGRPRQFDPDLALGRIRHAFWRHGYEATSLDMLCEATAMKRPSLYAAFGDKSTIYRTVLVAFADEMGRRLDEALDAHAALPEALAAFFGQALDLYADPSGRPLGCLVIGTALPVAAADDDIRAILAQTLSRIDATLERRLSRARQAGELPSGTEPAALATLLGAVLQSLAIRARAGATRDDLLALAMQAIDQLIPAAPDVDASGAGLR